MAPELAVPGPSRPGPPRVLALCLPDLPLQRLRRERGGAAARPLAVVHEGRVSACDPAARAQGVRPGDSAVQAEAACAGLELVPLDPAGDQEALAALAEALLGLAPVVELAPPDTLLLDASAAHLLAGAGRGPEEGEARLLARAQALAGELGYRCRAALASGKGAARALARHGRGGTRPVPPEATAAALAPLPLAALPEIPPELAAQLEGLGLADVGSLARLPPETLAHRFGLFAGVLLRLSRGEDPTPLVPYLPRRLPEESLELEAPAESAEILLFALKRVVDRTVARLAGRGLGATRLDLSLRLDPRGEARLSVPLARPGAAASVWLLLLRERLLALTLEAPVAGLRLAVGEAVAAAAEQLGLGDRPEELRALETVLARLAARLGEGALFAAAPADRHRPEAAYRTGPFAGKRDGKGRQAAAQVSAGPIAEAGRRSLPPPPPGRGRGRSATSRSSVGEAVPASPSTSELARPTRLLAAPLPLVALGEGGRLAAVRCQGRTHRVLALSSPERLAGEWWSAPFDRDYHRALLEGLGSCWIYRDGADGRLWLHGFFD